MLNFTIGNKNINNVVSKCNNIIIEIMIETIRNERDER